MFRLNWALIVALGLLGSGIARSGEPDPTVTLPPGLRAEMKIDPREILAEPLEDTLNAIHTFWWSPLDPVPTVPSQYVEFVRGLPRIQKLLTIAEKGSEEEKAVLLAYINNWADRFVHEYPTGGYVGNSSELSGFSAVVPGMDAALMLVLAKLDPSPTSLQRIVQVANRHAEASREHSARKKLPAREPDHLPGTQSMYVFAFATLELVEDALKNNAEWLNEAAWTQMHEAVQKTRESKEERQDYSTVLKASQSWLSNALED